MSLPQLLVELCHPHAQMPMKKRKSDFGYDLYTPEDFIVDPMCKIKIDLGFKTEFPDIWGALLMDRSSVADAGCHVVGQVIDSEYRDTWKVMLWNLSDRPIGFLTGDKIAQFVLLPQISLQPREGKVSPSTRGQGFGSSGR